MMARFLIPHLSFTTSRRLFSRNIFIHQLFQQSQRQAAIGQHNIMKILEHKFRA